MHDHHALSLRVTMRDLRNHLLRDHRLPKELNAHLTNDFKLLNTMHVNAHNGHAPEYVEAK